MPALIKRSAKLFYGKFLKNLFFGGAEGGLEEVMPEAETHFAYFSVISVATLRCINCIK